MSLSQRLARLVLRLIGWRCLDFEGRPERAVLVGYPHTSNWDFPLTLLALKALGLNARWVGKDALFRGPMGPVMRWLGGIPINRREPTGFVERIAAMLRDEPPFVLAIAPEGTRSLTAGWKSGFYRIADSADLPIVLGTIDYSRRRVGLLGAVSPSGDENADMAAIAACYEGVRGRRPELASPIRLI